MIKNNTDPNTSSHHPQKVMAFGTFDLFHAGHENYLNQAKALGDTLIVVIARDETVRKIKGRYPDQTERQRLKNVKMSGIADKVILGYHGDKHKVLRKYRPDIIALGYDQFVFTQLLEKTLIDLKLNAHIERLKAYEPHVYKSSLLRAERHRGLQEKITLTPASSISQITS